MTEAMGNKTTVREEQPSELYNHATNGLESPFSHVHGREDLQRSHVDDIDVRQFPYF